MLLKGGVVGIRVEESTKIDFINKLVKQSKKTEECGFRLNLLEESY
jgi:hypothetical protein